MRRWLMVFGALFMSGTLQATSGQACKPGGVGGQGLGPRECALLDQVDDAPRRVLYQDADQQVFLDRSSSRRNDRLIDAQLVYTRVRPEPARANLTSRQLTVQLDCKNGTERVVEESRFDRPNGLGPPLSTNRFAGAQPTKLKPGTVEAAVFAVLCPDFVL